MLKRRSMLAAAIAVLLSVLVALVGFGVYQVERLSNRLSAALCGVTVGRILPSPDAKTVLVSYVVDCGATTPSSTQATLLRSGSKFSREAYPRFFSVKGEHDLAARWVDNATLEIAVPLNAEVYARETRAAGVVITYK
jgi:hypothetical protein